MPIYSTLMVLTLFQNPWFWNFLIIMWDLRNLSTIMYINLSSVVKVPNSWLKGRGFKSLQEQCWLLFQYLFHPCVTAVARKRSQSFFQSAGGKLQLNTLAPYVCGFAWSDMVHGYMVYTERAEMTAVSCGTSHVSTVGTPLQWIFENAYKNRKKK